ncbi:MAG: hypothetical protein HQM08_14355 [Candidatus Riflebacteria bacterium]|nr:hypothetical protein [Candidatus Riflebacteria bacterium]
MESDKILQIAEASEIRKYQWNNRGLAPAGYIKGMAAVYARVYCKLKAKFPEALEMAKPLEDPGRDALAWFFQEFSEVGLDKLDTPNDRLRYLFVLLIGLGMRESSGRYCEGRDRSVFNTRSETAEAGLFQTSFNAHLASDLMLQLFNFYKGKTDFLEIFREGVFPKPSDLENYGSGDGFEFQKLSKECPGFAVEFTAVGLRNIRRHWGPINRMEAEIRPECDEMLQKVQFEIDVHDLCPFLI